MNETAAPATNRTAQHAATAEPISPTTAAIGATALGLLLLIVAFANLNRMPGWADDYGAILVYLAFFLFMSLAGRLTWWGIDTLRDQTKARRNRR
ncbi:hypothetical protein [Nocardia sp. NPDC052566]|uniref:hypothetical protein n=1 Tax=Nocardia sp. NPDC052566 TaxID=3364330 RepID=UPI0037C8289D